MCFLPLFEWEQGVIVKLESCAVANLLQIFQGNNFGCKVCISFHVGIFIIIDSASESIKKSISRSGD